MEDGCGGRWGFRGSCERCWVTNCYRCHIEIRAIGGLMWVIGSAKSDIVISQMSEIRELDGTTGIALSGLSGLVRYQGLHCGYTLANQQTFINHLSLIWVNPKQFARRRMHDPKLVSLSLSQFEE